MVKSSHNSNIINSGKNDSDKKELDKKDLAKEDVPLLSLPKEVLFKIVHHATDGDIDQETKFMAVLLKTRKHFSFFQPILKEREIKQLAQYIGIAADEVNAEAMVKINPGLLLIPVDEVINPNTNQITKNVKPLQLARSEGDDKMCVMLKSYFEPACGSKEAASVEIQKQLDEKFGKGSNKFTERKEIRMKRLTALIDVISREQFNNGQEAGTNRRILNKATQKAITKFRSEFSASQPKIIYSGMRFHLNILQEVCDAYTSAAMRWQFNFFQCALLEDAVLSTVLCYVPTNDAQRFNQGLYFIQHQKEEFKRACKNRAGHHFYQHLLNQSANFVLSGSYIDIEYGGDTASSGGLWQAHRERIGTLKNLCKEKTLNFQSLGSTNYSPCFHII
jgi:hypothetical protein